MRGARGWSGGMRGVVGVALLLSVNLAGLTGAAGALSAPAGQVMTADGRVYDAYVPPVPKFGQFYTYSCEFDAAWVVLATFGYDVPFEEQLAIVGHDTSIEPWWQETATGYVIYGGDITSSFSGDYTANLLARTSAAAMRPLFEEFGLAAEPVDSRRGVEAALDGGALVWTKATVDFLPWQPTVWITPDGEEIPTVLGNDHAVVVIGYNADVVVISDPLGPTDTNWNRPYEYEVAWPTFMAVWEAQDFNGLAVGPATDETDAPANPAHTIPGIEITGST